MDDSDKTRQALEALAELYLTGPEQATDATSEPAEAAAAHDVHSAAPTAARIEGVLVGHLPGFAAPWLTQYADHLAGKHGPVAICHVDADELDIDLVQPNPDRKPNHLAMTAPPTDRKLPDLLAELSIGVGAWLVHLGDPVMPLTQRLASQVDTWTILTGCDEAALVAAYQLLKKLIRHGAAAPSRVQLMFMGCDPADADPAAARIARAAERFLSVPVETAGSRRQMQPVLKRPVGSFEHAPEVQTPHWQVFGEFIEQLKATPAAEPDEVAADEPDIEELEQAMADIADASPPPEPPEGAEPAGSREASKAAADRASAKPQAAPSSAQSLVPSPHFLAGFVDDLEPLDARCPHHPAVQLATDPAGHLHVLAHATGEAIRSAIADLLAASGWAQQNATLLTSSPEQDHPALPVLHLFIDRPKAVTDLVAAGTIRLHLLLPVTIADRTTWHHIELN